jgi:hypothetical protein
MNNPSVLEEVVPTRLPLSLALAGRRHWTDYGMAPMLEQLNGRAASNSKHMLLLLLFLLLLQL